MQNNEKVGKSQALLHKDIHTDFEERDEPRDELHSGQRVFSYDRQSKGGSKNLQWARTGLPCLCCLNLRQVDIRPTCDRGETIIHTIRIFKQFALQR